MFHRQNSLGPNRYGNPRRANAVPHPPLRSASSMYGSDFFYPPVSTTNTDEEQHEYDNLTFLQSPTPFPTILVDCQRCSHSVDRSSLRDISCQMPSDEDLYQDIQLDHRQPFRSTLVYHSPRSSLASVCQPPHAETLLAPHHSRRKHSLSSYTSTHNRSKSVPLSSSLSTRKTRSPPPLSPVPSIAAESVSEASTNTLLRSIKTSIHAMKKRLKDIRRFSEVRTSAFDSMTTVTDDLSKRSGEREKN